MIMKKELILLSATTLLLASCGTYAGSGAYAGASLGSILGSAIGGISGGPRGSDVGTLIGMASGAIVGGSIGAEADKQKQADLDRYYNDKAQRQQNRQQQNQYEQDYNNGSGYDPNGGGDDRLYDFDGSDYTSDYSAKQPNVVAPKANSTYNYIDSKDYQPRVEIRNARFVDSNRDNAINRGEVSKVIFEVYNHGKTTLYDVQPIVSDATNNRHLFISPGIHIESLAPGQGIRYTAIVKADSRLRDGEARICISVVQDGKTISSVQEFSLPTRR